MLALAQQKVVYFHNPYCTASNDNSKCNTHLHSEAGF